MNKALEQGLAGQNWVDLINAASKNHLAMTALGILIISTLAYLFFKGAPVWFRLAVFIILFSGLGILVAVMFDLLSDHHVLVVKGNEGWQDSNITLQKDEMVSITAKSKIQYTNRPSAPFEGYADADGVPPVSLPRADNTSNDFTKYSEYPEWPHAMLIGRIGTTPIKIGQGTEFRAPATGRLELRANDRDFANNSGSWIVTINTRRFEISSH